MAGIEGKKVGLIRPPAALNKFRFVNSQPPINLAGLGSWLEQFGVEVEIRDFDVESPDIIGDWLNEFAPDLIGITSMTPMILSAADIAARIKELAPELPIVVGGPHATALPERTLNEFAAFDFAVSGEGEHPLRELLAVLKNRRFSQVPGLTWRGKSGLQRNPVAPLIGDLDSLPLPNRDLLPLDKYGGQSFRGFARGTYNICELITARGCPAACIFCASQDRRVRLMSAERVAEDLRLCKEKYGSNHVVFMDDTFTVRPSRLRQILKTLRELDMTFNCTTRVDVVNEPLLAEMHESGCRGISFGIESGSARIQQMINKNITPKQVIASFDAAHRVGIEHLEANFILGVHPDENEDDIAETIALIDRIRPHVLFVATVVPYPGTPLYDMMIERGLLAADADWREFLFFGTEPSWRTEHYTIAELADLQRKLLRRHYFSLRYLGHVLKTFKGWADLKYYAGSAVAFLRS
jgi:radical SAM superfamily enzyme YgiQ (UPF0313 family)